MNRTTFFTTHISSMSERTQGVEFYQALECDLVWGRSKSSSNCLPDSHPRWYSSNIGYPNMPRPSSALEYMEEVHGRRAKHYRSNGKTRPVLNNLYVVGSLVSRQATTHFVWSTPRGAPGRLLPIRDAHELRLRWLAGIEGKHGHCCRYPNASSDLWGFLGFHRTLITYPHAIFLLPCLFY
jgi:hypothetical protein